MQGSYKDNGLPRPYYMKPSKRGSAYDSMPRQFFFTNTRKLGGYAVLLVLFSLCLYLVGQELRPSGAPSFEIENVVDVQGSNGGDVGRLVDSAKGDQKENEKGDLALNKAQNSKGEYGHAVMEAPKGGMVNEAPIVGNDEDLVVDGKTKKKVVDSGNKGFRATRGTDDEQTVKSRKGVPDEDEDIALMREKLNSPYDSELERKAKKAANAAKADSKSAKADSKSAKADSKSAKADSKSVKDDSKSVKADSKSVKADSKSVKAAGKDSKDVELDSRDTAHNGAKNPESKSDAKLANGQGAQKTSPKADIPIGDDNL